MSRSARAPARINTVEALVYLDTAALVAVAFTGTRWALAGLAGLWLVGRARAP